jgi:hypothetical protein
VESVFRSPSRMQISQRFGKLFIFRLQGKWIYGLSVGPHINLTMSGVSEMNAWLGGGGPYC